MGAIFLYIKFLYICKVNIRFWRFDMNIAMRKLTMLERDFEEKEERARIDGCVSSPINIHLQRQVKDLMDKIRTILSC